MLVQPIEVSPWKANCYVVSGGEGATDCVIVDPGIGATAAVDRTLRELGLTPVAILATHGHLDHVGDAHLLAAAHAIPVYLAAADQHLLTRPGDGLGPHGGAMMLQLTGGETLPTIEDVRDYDGPFTLAGLRITPFAAPGHTAGSVLLQVSSGEGSLLLTGDVLFAGTIGRTDLPGGSMDQMRETLRRIVEHFPREMPLLPGHGQPTGLELELETNPYLQPNQL